MCDELTEISRLRAFISREGVIARADLQQMRCRLSRFRERAARWPHNERLLLYIDLSILETEELISQAVKAERRN
jgi:hypothetical protein